MRGKLRIRKKRLKRAGWKIISASRMDEKTYQLTLESPDGEEVTIEERTRPRAYLRAERELLTED
ncbi:MAG TPA: hypothetical protein VKA68_07295 [bacterium]|nr:hypothetical protein [bacterium]